MNQTLNDSKSFVVKSKTSSNTTVRSRVELINVNKYRIVAIIPAAGISERFRNNNQNKPSTFINNKNNSNNNNNNNIIITNNNNNNSISISSSRNNKSKHEQAKQYQNICGRALIYHTVCAYLRIKWIDFIIVVAPKDSLQQMEQILSPLVTRQQKRFDCIAGAESRHYSIKIGIDFIQNQQSSADIVIIHDGARPFVDQDTLHRVVSIADIYGAAGIVCKLTSTILNLEEKEEEKFEEKNCYDKLYKIKCALDRSQYWASEMPQAFKTSLLIKAYEMCSNKDFQHNTECLDLLQRYTGTEARLFQVDENRYFKVTYRKDLYTADNVLKEHRNILLHFDFFDKSISINYKFIKDIKDDLCESFSAVNYFNNSTVNDRYQSNAAHHSTGFVHVRIHYCHQWNDVLNEINDSHLINYEHLIYLVIISPSNSKILPNDRCQNSDNNDDYLEDAAYPKLTQWARTKVNKKEVKNFFLIFVHCNNLDKQSERIRKTIVYLSRELPIELSGQTFFM